MANPDHDGVIKSFTGVGAAQSYLGELDELLNDTDEDEDEEEEEEKINWNLNYVWINHHISMI